MAENLLLQLQILSGIPNNFHYRYDSGLETNDFCNKDLGLAWFVVPVFGFPAVPLGRFFLGMSLLLTGKFFCLRLVFVAYGQLAWSFLLTVCSFLLMVEIRFGLFTYGSACPEVRFGLFCLRFPPSGNWVWSFLLTVPPP